MKKFLLKVSVFVIYAFIVQVVVPVAIDPFNVFHAEKIRANGVEPNKNYIKMTYILNNPDKFNGFLFGSSRVGAIHTEKIQGERVYNMTYSGGLPCEHLANIKTFIKHGIIPAKIYIGIDSVSYTTRVQERISLPMTCPYEYLRDTPEHFYSLYLNTFDALKSLFSEANIHAITDVEEFYQTGIWFQYGMNVTFDWDKDGNSPTIGEKLEYDDTLNDISEIVKICHEHNIKLIIFTNPMYHVTYRASVKQNYFEFLEGLAKITDFYNFSSLNDITLDNKNYHDTSHYKAEIGDLIIDVICNGKIFDDLYSQGFGVKVTKENSEKFIKFLKEQLN